MWSVLTLIREQSSLLSYSMLSRRQTRTLTKWIIRCRNLLEQFAFSMKYIHTLTTPPKGFNNPMLGRLYEASELAKMTIEQREKYDSEMRTWIDEIAQRQFAREEGREEGKLAATKNIAANLKAQGLPDKDIAKATGMSEQESEAL